MDKKWWLNKIAEAEVAIKTVEVELDRLQAIAARAGDVEGMAKEIYALSIKHNPWMEEAGCYILDGLTDEGKERWYEIARAVSAWIRGE